MTTTFEIPPRHTLPAVSEPGLNPMFKPFPGGDYLGADGVLSIPITPTKIFWLFGDTLIGEMDENGRRHRDYMPRNTIGIQDISGGLPGETTRYWDMKDGKPTDFFLLDDPSGVWYWPGTGFMLDGELYLVGYALQWGEGPFAALAFEVLDMWMIRIANPEDDPRAWNYTTRKMIFDAESPRFCSAHYMDETHVYFIGMDRKGDRPYKGLASVLARVEIDKLKAGDLGENFEFWVESSDGPVWSDNSANLHPLYVPAVTEGSVYRDTPRDRFIATSYRAGRPTLEVAIASEITGPWSAPITIYCPEEHDGRDDLISYALRIHPHLESNPDELILTYVTNTEEIEGVFSNPAIYYPKFIRLDLRQLDIPTPRNHDDA